MRRLVLILVIIAAVLLVPAVIRTSAPDAEPPAEIAGRLDEFRDVLSRQLELPPSVVRFIGAERAANDFIMLRFELRPFPFLVSEGAYLVSRCAPLRGLDPWSMGGGRGVADFGTDAELVHLRAQAGDPCP